MLLLITAGIVVLGVFGTDLRNAILSSGFLLGVLALNVVLFGWRGLAIWDAATNVPAPRRAERQWALVAAAALVVTALIMHGWVGVVVAHLNGALTEVFDGAPAELPGPGGDGDDNGDGDGNSDSEEAPDDGGDATPEYRWDGTERVNVLLIGTDAAPGRDHILTDVIMVVSVDPVAQTAAMVSVPRDTGYLPLPDASIYRDGLFPGKANELATTAASEPEVWCPDAELAARACGIRSLQRSVELYLGIEIQHYALIDMAGFAELIDAVGGLELCLPGRLVDPDFGDALSAADGGTLELPAGCHHYGGLEALAYARSRQGWIEMADGTTVQQTDFDRNERQQRVLLALRQELAQGDLVFELPSVLGAVGRTVATDFPRDQAGDLASLLPLITGPDIDRVVLGHPEFVELPVEPDVNYLLIPKRDAIRAEMERIFGADALRGWYLATEAPGPTPAD